MSFARFSTRLSLESLGDRLCPSATGGMSQGKVSWNDPIYVSRGTPCDAFVGEADASADNGHGTHVAGTIGAMGNNRTAPAGDDVIVDGRIITGENYDSAAIVFVGGWGSSVYQYAYNDPIADSAPDDLASEQADSEIAVHGYIKIKKLNSGG